MRRKIYFANIEEHINRMFNLSDTACMKKFAVSFALKWKERVNWETSG